MGRKEAEGGRQRRERGRWVRVGGGGEAKGGGKDRGAGDVGQGSHKTGESQSRFDCKSGLGGRVDREGGRGGGGELRGGCFTFCQLLIGPICWLGAGEADHLAALGGQFSHDIALQPPQHDLLQCNTAPRLNQESTHALPNSESTMLAKK